MKLNEKQRERLAAILKKGHRITKIKGHSPYNKENRENQEVFYKKAKEPVGKYQEHLLNSVEEIENWLQQGGWIGLILDGLTALDVDKDKYKIELVKWFFVRKNIKPITQKTKNGYHFIFQGETFNNPDYLSKLGVNLTIKSGGNTYLIIEPSEYKEFITDLDFDNLPSLPDEFQKLNKYNKNELLDVIKINIAFCKEKKIVSTYNTLISYVTILVKEGFSDDEILKHLQYIFGDKYDEYKSRYYLDRTKERLNNNELLKGLPTLKEIFAAAKVNNVVELIDLYSKAKNKSSNADDIVILEENKPEINTFSKIEPFPLWTLPDVFQHVATQVGKAFNRNHEIPAVTLLWTTGGVIGRTRKVFQKRDFSTYPNTYISLVAPSGMRKSPIIRFFWNILKQKDYKLFLEYQEKLKEYEKECIEYERNVKDYKRGKISEIPDKCQVQNEIVPQMQSENVPLYF